MREVESTITDISFDNSNIKLLLLSIISVRFIFPRHKAVFTRNKFGSSCNVDNVNDVGNIDDNDDTNEVDIDVIDIVDVVDVVDWLKIVNVELNCANNFSF